MKQTSLIVIASAGTRPTNTHREHDPSLREGQSRLVDQHGPLQPGTYPARRHGGQDGVQEEPGALDTTLLEGGAGEAAQLSESG